MDSQGINEQERAAASSWTDEKLPLEVRRQLLDRALDELRARKARGGADSRQYRSGRAGSQARTAPGARDGPAS